MNDGRLLDVTTGQPLPVGSEAEQQFIEKLHKVFDAGNVGLPRVTGVTLPNGKPLSFVNTVDDYVGMLKNANGNFELPAQLVPPQSGNVKAFVGGEPALLQSNGTYQVGGAVFPADSPQLKFVVDGQPAVRVEVQAFVDGKPVTAGEDGMFHVDGRVIDPHSPEVVFKAGDHRVVGNEHAYISVPARELPPGSPEGQAFELGLRATSDKAAGVTPNHFKDAEGNWVAGDQHFSPDSPEGKAFAEGLSYRFDEHKWGDANAFGYFGADRIGGVRVPPLSSGFNYDMTVAMSKGMSSVVDPTGQGRTIVSISARDSEPSGAVWHAFTTPDGKKELYVLKPEGMLNVKPNVEGYRYDHFLQTVTDLDYPGSKWALQSLPHNQLEQVPRLNTTIKNDPSAFEAVQAEILEINKKNQAENVATVVGIIGSAETGYEVVQVERIVGDVDLMHAQWSDGSYLTADEILAPGGLKENINQAYHDMGYKVDLINHGAHVDGMMNNYLNEKYGLTWAYKNQPVYVFGGDGYQGSAHLLTTFKAVTGVDPSIVVMPRAVSSTPDVTDIVKGAVVNPYQAQIDARLAEDALR
jgi:hypothetical protein